MLARGIFQFQLRRAFASKTLPYALLFSFGVMCVCFIQMCLKFWGHDTSEIPSAVVAWVGNCDATETNVFSYFINYMMAPVAAAIFGDSFCADVKGGLAASGATRSSFACYVLSGAAAAYLLRSLRCLQSCWVPNYWRSLPFRSRVRRMPINPWGISLRRWTVLAICRKAYLVTCG